MKPARGSSRTPGKGPKKQKNQKPDGVTLQNPAQKRKVQPESSGVTKKIKGQEKLSELPTSSIKAIEHLMELSILETLALNHKEKKDSQEHLNQLKKRFLTHCPQLKVPTQKQKNWLFSSQLHQEERKKSADGKQTLSSLEEHLKSVVGTLERIDEQAEALQHSCIELRNELMEEEEKAKEIFKLTDEAHLKLLPLPPQRDETSFESRLRKILPDPDSAARKLGAVLQRPGSNRDAEMLLLQAHKHADLLFNPINVAASSPEETELNFSRD